MLEYIFAMRLNLCDPSLMISLRFAARSRTGSRAAGRVAGHCCALRVNLPHHPPPSLGGGRPRSRGDGPRSSRGGLPVGSRRGNLTAPHPRSPRRVRRGSRRGNLTAARAGSPAVSRSTYPPCSPPRGPLPRTLPANPHRRPALPRVACR